MSKAREPLGPLELQVLRHLAAGPPRSVGEVGKHFAETAGLARTTVLTVMERLRAKGYLSRRKLAGVLRYSPTLSKADLLQGLVAEFVSDVLEGAASPFVAYLSESGRLTAPERQKLENLLRQLEAREREEREP
jgi:predicted transcriptional regulator